MVENENTKGTQKLENIFSFLEDIEGWGNGDIDRLLQTFTMIT